MAWLGHGTLKLARQSPIQWFTITNYSMSILAQMERMWRQPVQITQHEFGMRKAENQLHHRYCIRVELTQFPLTRHPVR